MKKIFIILTLLFNVCFGQTIKVNQSTSISAQAVYTQKGTDAKFTSLETSLKTYANDKAISVDAKLQNFAKEMRDSILKLSIRIVELQKQIPVLDSLSFGEGIRIWQAKNGVYVIQAQYSYDPVKQAMIKNW